MCLAVPGKVIETDGITAKVDFSGNILNVELSLVTAEIGDYVLVHAGVAIAVLAEDEALETINLYAEVEDCLK
ncbi:MAG TPA: HypC/HybG/HupF family hydrogenase formation chaperone [Clostridia bacterium]|nr:HypC/HybG/HupF family hydrogenase formation chaperone [Clostridia bacterium]